MKTFPALALLAIASLLLSACGPAVPAQTSVPTSLPGDTGLPSLTPSSATLNPPVPTPVTTSGLSSTASTRTELSFTFPGQWDGSSPLTFGEGEFVKDPNQPIGVTFQINLSGDPAALLNTWGTKDVGIPGIVTFTPESVTDGPNVTIARVPAPTRIAQGNAITAQVAYIQRADDVMEVMWFSPSGQWEDLQPVFQQVLDSVEIWRKYADAAVGLQTMYVHDWMSPRLTWQDTGVWFRSADERTGMAVFVKDEIADPALLLGSWSTERLAPLGFTACTLEQGDRMDSLGGQWESRMGDCTGTGGEEFTYEVSFVPNKNRLLEVITYAPSSAWTEANAIAFKYLLSMMVDIRP